MQALERLNNERVHISTLFQSMCHVRQVCVCVCVYVCVLCCVVLCFVVCVCVCVAPRPESCALNLLKHARDHAKGREATTCCKHPKLGETSLVR